MDAERWGRAGWAVWTVVVLLAAGGAASRPGAWALGLPGVLVTLLVIAAGAAAAWRLGATAGRLGLGLAVVPVLLVAGVPIPGVRALSGPPLFALALGVLALAVARRGVPAWAGRALLPVVLVVYGIAAWRAQVQVGPEGDEPHYLMVAESLIRDHDVSLERDYAEGRYQAFHPAPLAPHYRVRGRNGEIYSLHAVGLSLLILPAYALGGYPAVSFFLALLAALLVREIRGLLAGWLDDDGTATGVAWLLALSPPLVSYAGLVFTEVPAALGVAVALRRARGSTTSGAVAGGLAQAAIPWLNARYGIVAALIVVYVVSHRPDVRRAAAWLLPMAVSAAALAAWHHHLYGFLNPGRVYGRRPELSLATVPEGLPGLFLDQEFGLLAYAPVFVLALPGVIGLARRSRRDALLAVALVAAVVGTAALWPMWRGGFNPPARFLVPIVPVLALLVAARIRAAGLTAGVALLAGWGLWTGLTGALDPRLVHRDRDGTAPLFRERSGAEEWTRLLPGYVLDESIPDRVRLSLVWTVALGGAALLGRRAPGPWGVAAVCGGLLAAAGAASSLSHGRTEGRDAVRLAGRPALAVPGWHGVHDAWWTPADLGWGPVYEPHRFPAGAVVGERLGLPRGSCSLELGIEGLGGGSPRAEVQVVQGSARSGMALVQGTAPTASFGVDGVAPVTLVLNGNGPFILKELRLHCEPTFSPLRGLSP
jgi:hypothetical protein